MQKILSACNRIAQCGRIGPGTNILISEKNYNKYNINRLIELMNQPLIVLFDDKLIDNMIVYRKNTIDQPGLFLLYNKNNNMYNILEIGFYPDKQFVNIQLI